MTDPHWPHLLRRWWWALLLATVVAAGAGFAAASHATKRYEARVDLLVGPVNGTVDLDGSGALARTYADLATSEPILRAALRAGKDPRTAQDIRDSVTTSSNAITRIVNVAVRDPDPRAAARLANDIGAQLRRLANTTPPVAAAALEQFSHQPEVARLASGRQDAVLAAATRVFGASQAGRIGVVQEAVAPPGPASPSIPLMTMLAALAGLCLGAFVVFVQEVRERVRLEAALPAGRPAGALTVIDGAGGGGLAELRSGADGAESYRMLAARTHLTDARDAPASLLVVDSGDGSAAATVAASLAAAVAAAGREVILADLDPHGAGVTARLGLGGRPGTSNLIADPKALTERSDALERALVASGEHLSVLAGGTAATARVQPVARLSTLVSRLSERADVVVLAGPALTRSSTMIAWARTVDQVCLVVDSEADGDEVQRVVVGLERLDGGFVGAILRGREGSPGRRAKRRVS